MKKRSSLLIIALLALLAGFSVYLYFAKSKFSTVDSDDRAFAFEDTAAITKIFLADKDKHRSTVVRTEKGWRVNDKYNCRSDAILNLLEVIRNVEVKMPVPKSMRENVIKFMTFNAVKVEIYAGDEKVRQYYVGHETEDGEGSYMILTDLENDRNFENPYVCFIPGFIGYLQPRYIADENDWRDRIVMNYIPPQIQQIRVEHSGMAKDSSFVIELRDANSFVLKDLSGKTLPFDDAKMRQYLIYYQNLSYESLITGRSRRLTDSLSLQHPFTTITIKKKQGGEDVFKFYRKKYEGGFTSDMAQNYEYDPDRFFMSFDGGRQWALAQYFVFGKLCISGPYFSSVESVKK